MTHPHLCDLVGGLSSLYLEDRAQADEGALRAKVSVRRPTPVARERDERGHQEREDELLLETEDARHEDLE